MTSRLLAAVAALSLVGPAASAEAPAAPRVTLISAGDGAKAPLRLALEPGVTQRMTMTMVMDMKMSMNGNAMPSMKVPPIKMVMDLKVTEASAGKATVALTLRSLELSDSAGAAPQLVDAMRQATRGLVGLKGTYVTDARGTVSSLRLDPPPDTSPAAQKMIADMKRSFAQLTVPLPAEPVGVGARWSVAQTIEQNGMRIDQTVTYALKKREGAKLTLAYSLSQRAEAQDVAMPGMPDGAKARLLSLSGEGRGSSVLDLSKPGPTSGSATVDTGFKMSVDVMGEGATIDTKIGISMTVE